MTERLSAIDSTFLDESPETGPPMAIGVVLTIGGDVPDIREVRDLIRSRRELLPRLFERLQKSRANLILRAKWVDTEPDLAHHIKVFNDDVTSRGLAGAVASIMERPMDRSLPLWDLTVIPDVPGEDWAMVLRLHHTLADGQGMGVLLGQLCEFEPDGATTVTQATVAADAFRRENNEDEGSHSGPMPSPSDAVEKIRSSVEKLMGTASRIPGTARSLADFSPHPNSPLLGTPSEGRSWVGVDASLAAVKATGRAMKSTVNDVILAAVAQGFTELLTSRGEDVKGQTLHAMMPVTLRDPTDLTSNNQVAVVPVSLPLGVDDFSQLLASVHESTMQAKTSLTPEIIDALAGLATRAVPNAVQEIMAKESTRFGGHWGEVVVTNVPGAPVPLYFMGRKIKSQFPILPVLPPTLFGVAITSYGARLQIAVNGDDSSWDEVNLLATTIGQTLDSSPAVT